jgi:putative transposase
MATLLRFLPGGIIRWSRRQYVIVDYAGLDAILGRQLGKRRLERIPINEAEPDDRHASSAWMPPDLVSVPEEEWQVAARRFDILRPLLTMDAAKRTLADVERAARVLGKHRVTVYRWIEDYERAGRLSILLRNKRSDRGASRLSNKVEKIIDTAIKSVYLSAEKPTMAAVNEEVWLQCFKKKIKTKPAANTIRARILMLSDRLRMEKREGKRRAAEKYEPIKGHFPGADVPLAVTQIDHTPMDARFFV